MRISIFRIASLCFVRILHTQDIPCDVVLSIGYAKEISRGRNYDNGVNATPPVFTCIYLIIQGKFGNKFAAMAFAYMPPEWHVTNLRHLQANIIIIINIFI